MTLLSFLVLGPLQIVLSTCGMTIGGSCPSFPNWPATRASSPVLLLTKIRNSFIVNRPLDGPRRLGALRAASVQRAQCVLDDLLDAAKVGDFRH